MTIKHDPEELHPILNAATQMVIGLYERERTEHTRKKLIALENTLRQNLEKLEQAKDRGDKSR